VAKYLWRRRIYVKSARLRQDVDIDDSQVQAFLLCEGPKLLSASLVMSFGRAQAGIDAMSRLGESMGDGSANRPR